MNWQLENKKRYWRVAVSSILLVGTTALFVFIGATGDSESKGHLNYVTKTINSFVLRRRHLELGRKI